MMNLEYKVEGNQLIIKRKDRNEVYTFDQACEEKVYDSDGRCWYKSNK